MSDRPSDRPEPPADPGAPPVWLPWLLRALVVLPIAVAVVRAIATGWFPVGDNALLAVRAYDVGTAHHPLLGSWTSASLTLGENVNNPGPLYADLMAPFMWTVGRGIGIGPAVALGVGSINAGFALLTAWAARRLGGWRTERLGLLLVAALTWSMGSELLIDVWQPHALLLPFLSLLILTAALLAGRWTLAPVWLGVVSLVVQTHLGYVYVVGMLVLLVAAHGMVELARRSVPVSEVVTSRTSAWSLGVVVLAWSQPLIEQFTADGRGNLARLATNAGGGDITIGAGTAVKLVARVVALPPWWTRWGFEDAVESTPLTDTVDGPRLFVPGLPGPLVAAVSVVVVLAALVALRVRARRSTASAAMLTVALAGTVTAVATLAIQTVSIVGLGSHHVRWLWVLSLFVLAAAVSAVIELTEPRWSTRWREGMPFASPAVIALLVGANLGMHAHDLGPTADRSAADTLERTFDDLAEFDPGGPVEYRVDDLRPFEPWSSAVWMRMRELGIAFRVDDAGVVRQLGDRRRVDGSEVTTVRQVERGAAVRFAGPGCVISAASPFDDAGNAWVDGIIADTVDDLTAGRIEVRVDGLDDDLRRRLEAAAAGDTDEGFVLVADGVLALLADDGRVTGTTDALDLALEHRLVIERRVVGTLVLVADPPVGCPAEGR